MIRILRALAGLFPSVPPSLQARVLAAMEGRTPSPAPGPGGEAGPGAGHTFTAATSIPVAVDHRPEGEVVGRTWMAPCAVAARPPVTLLDWGTDR